MTAPSNANTSGLEVVAWDYRTAPHRKWHRTENPGIAEEERAEGSEVVPYSVTAASAQARIAELEAERDQIAGESIWWKAVISDGEYTPSGEVPSIKHLHPAMVKPIYEAHKGTAVADVIAGLIFSRAITENREQFLVGYHIDRATAAEARADRLAKDTKGLLAEIASFGRAFMAAQQSLEATSTPDAYDDAILAASVQYQTVVKTASALYRAALQQEG